MEWNNDSLPATIKLPRGGIIENTFEGDLTSPDQSARGGNLRVQVTTAAPAVPSDVGTITQTWGYLPGFGTCEGSSYPGGRALMLDGTPVVSDVLFTKGSSGSGSTGFAVTARERPWHQRIGDRRR